MSNIEQIHVEEQDPAGAIPRPFVDSDPLDNVIPFPLQFATDRSKTVITNYTEPDPAPAQGIDRTHIDYQLAKGRIEASIKETRQAKDNEASRQARLLRAPNNPDEIAEGRSEAAFGSVSNLERPAGTREKIGSDVLRIIGE